MATDIKKIISNLFKFYNFDNKEIISVGAGGGQLIEYGRNSKNVSAVDCNERALSKLRDNLTGSGLEDKFTLIYSDFYLTDLKGDLVVFEFCLHEMKDAETALKHAQTMAPDVLILDHWPGSEWAFTGNEEENIVKSWAALNRFHLKKIQKYDTVQVFHDYEEIYQKVKLQGEISIERINKYKDKTNFSIPMSYGFALI